MRNEEVIEKFLNKEKAQTPRRIITGAVYCYEGRTLVSTGIELINYNTIIAKHKNGNLYINKQKYSSTTSKIQSKLAYLARNMDVDVVEITEKEIYEL